MPIETDPTPGAPRPARALSPLTAALGLAAIAVVAAGAAWVGHARQPAAPSAPPPAAPGAAPTSAPVAIAAEVRALLDGGNAAFRAGQYEAALGHYRAAAQRAPAHAAPWYGIQMAALKLGRTALADSAMAAIRARTGDSTAWDDGAMRKAHEASRGGP